MNKRANKFFMIIIANKLILNDKKFKLRFQSLCMVQKSNDGVS